MEKVALIGKGEAFFSGVTHRTGPPYQGRRPIAEAPVALAEAKITALEAKLGKLTLMAPVDRVVILLAGEPNPSRP